MSHPTRLCCCVVAFPRFWFYGVVAPVIGGFGLLGNILTVVVLCKTLRKRNRSTGAAGRRMNRLFNNLLLTLAVFDLMFLVFSGCKMVKSGFQFKSPIYNYSFPYLIHPLAKLSLIGSTFMTAAVAIERFDHQEHNPQLPAIPQSYL